MLVLQAVRKRSQDSTWGLTGKSRLFREAQVFRGRSVGSHGGLLKQAVMWLIHLYLVKHEARVRRQRIGFKSRLLVSICIRHTLSGLRVPSVQWEVGPDGLSQHPFSVGLTPSLRKCLLNIFLLRKPDV